jgi:prepilin-type N-terminal cleavage/methylation domain-containing protein
MSSMPIRGHPHAGFTLIELLVVIVITGILATIAGTAVGRVVARDRVLRATTVVEGMLGEATQLAVRRRTPMQLRLRGSTLQIIQRGDTLAPVRSRRFDAGSDLQATLTLDPSGGITIFPNGRADRALTVTVSGEGARFQVQRSATGIVRRP